MNIQEIYVVLEGFALCDRVPKVLGSASDPPKHPLTLRWQGSTFTVLGYNHRLYLQLWWAMLDVGGAQMLVHLVSPVILGLGPRVHKGFD